METQGRKVIHISDAGGRIVHSDKKWCELCRLNLAEQHSKKPIWEKI
jgi:hypothetical protein